MPEHASVENLRLRLHWLGTLRWLAAGGMAAATLFVHFVLGLGLAWVGLLAVAGISAACNGLFHLLHRRLDAARKGALTFNQLERIANVEIAIDLVLLTLALHFSGGAENPFIVVYPLPPIIASILLTQRWAYLQAGWATLLLAGMTALEALHPSLHHPVNGYLSTPIFRDSLVIVGEVGALAFSVHVSVYLAGTLARRLHQREGQLRETRDALAGHTTELARMNEELRQLEEKKSRFLSLAAHQLRGPLAATHSCLVAACGGYASEPERQAELLRRARARIHSMLQVIRDLLTLAGTHELAQPSRQTAVDLDGVAARVVDQYVEFAASRQIDLVYFPPDREARVVGNETALADAIGNLVSNAVKYTREDGHVKVAVRVLRGDVVCEVIDDGIGIPEAEKEHLFQEFFRARNARASGQEGTGLGLAIVKEIVGRHGGRLTIESLENLGTCVVMSIPIAGETRAGAQGAQGT